jgi:hypothetical protein
MAEANAGRGLKVAQALRPYVAYVIPVAIAIILVFGYIDKFFS